MLLVLSFAASGGRCYGASAGTGTAGGVFLKLNTGVRAASMADAFIAVADDPSAIYWNPAGLTQMQLLSLSSTYTSWLAGISCASVAVARPLEGSALGASFNYVSIGGIEETTLSQPAGTGKVFSPSDYALNLAYARQPWPDISLGVNARLISESIDAGSASGYGMDVGMLWQVPFDLTVGFNARNLLGSLDGAPIPSNYGLGVCYRRSDLLVALDYNMPSDNQSTFNLGAEYGYRDVLFARIGFNTRSESGSGGSFGVGLGIKWSQLQLDYAYVPYGELGITHRFSLGVKFGAVPEGQDAERPGLK